MLRNQMSSPRKVVAVLAVLAVTALAGACGASAPEQFEGEWPRGVDRSIAGVTGSLELLLASRSASQTMFQASGRAEGDGLVDNALYSLWLSNQKGDVLSLDTDRADQECEVDPVTGDEGDCELVVKLRNSIPQAPFGVTTLEGLTLNIRTGLGVDGTIARSALNVANLKGDVVMEFTVTGSDP